MTMNNQRLYFTALLCGMAVLGVQAQKVSEEQALQRAKAFLSKKTASVLGCATMPTQGAALG